MTTQDDLRRRLRHVRFLGGSSGSGKSTVARLLAAEHGLRLYETEHFSRYVERTKPAEAPLLHTFVAMDMDERWLNRSPEVMRDTFHGFQGEGFHLVVEDLLVLPRTPPVLAEGFTLLPRLVGPLLSQKGQAVWLVASPEFRRAAFDTRGSTYDIAGKTSDPERALENLLERDRLFGEGVTAEAAALGLPVIHIDLGMSVEAVTARVSQALDLGQGVTAQTTCVPRQRRIGRGLGLRVPRRPLAPRPQVGRRLPGAAPPHCGSPVSSLPSIHLAQLLSSLGVRTRGCRCAS